MTLLADAIRRARLERNLSQAELARIVGVTKGAVSQWETARGMPDKSHIAVLANTLSLPLTLFVGAATEGNVTRLRDESRRWVPLISWTCAGRGAAAVDPYPAGVGVEYLEVSGEFSSASFALEVRGDSMLPRFRDGDVIVVDPTLAPECNNFVIAEILDPADPEAPGNVTFKQYKPRGATLAGTQVYDLVPLNPEEPTRTVNAQHPGRIIGVVVERRERLR